MNKLTLTMLLMVVLLVGFWLGKQHSKMCPSVTIERMETTAAGTPAAEGTEQ